MLKKLVLWLILAIILGTVLKTAFFGSSVNLAWKNNSYTPNQKLVENQILERFELEGFDDEGEQAWQLVGDTAHILEDGDIFIEKNVLLSVEKQIDVKGDKVLWQSQKSRFITNQDVVISHKDVEIQGTGSMGMVNDKFVQINRKIRMMIRSGTIVTCYGPAKIYYDENRVALYRDVWILDERGAVSADRMDGYFDPKEKELISVVASGNVRISRGEDVTFSDKAIYDTRTGSVRLEGAPEIDIRSAESAEEYKKYMDDDSPLQGT